MVIFRPRRMQAIARDGGDLEDTDEISISISATLPKVIIGSVDSITISYAIIWGEVTATGGSEVTARGVCWNTHLEGIH